MKPAWVLVLVGLGLTGACSSESGVRIAATTVPGAVETTTPAATDPPAPTGPTPWSEAVAAYDPETATDPAAALALFSLAFGPVTGTPLPLGEAAVASGATGDLTFAYRAALGVWDQLTDEQRAGVQAAMQAAPDSSTTEAAGFAGRRVADAPDPALVAAITAAAVQFRSTIAAKIGDFKGSLHVTVAEIRGTVPADVLAYANSPIVGGAYTDCNITVMPNGAAAGAEALLNIMAHEVFHCFQFDAYHTAAAMGRAPGWVIEGGAAWAAAVIADAQLTTSGYWRTYLTQITTPLPTRKYDAVGFWAHLAETGVDPWSIFHEVWKVGGTPASFVAAGADTSSFLDTWASGLLRDPARGPAWDTTGPFITNDMAAAKSLVVPDEGAVSVTAAPYSNGMLQMSTAADIVEFSTTGHVRVSDGTIDTVVATTEFCVHAGSCDCPDDPNDIPPALLGADAIVAVTGGPDGTTLSAIGKSLATHCKRPVQVFLDRPASKGLMAGRIVELTSCSGPYGHWVGVIRDGGITDGAGFDVAFNDIPIDVTLSTAAPSAHTTVTDIIPTPIGPVDLLLELDISTDGSTLSITGTGTAGTEVVSIETGLGVVGTGLPIVPAEPDACPG